MGKTEFTPLNQLLPKVTRQYNLERQVQGSLVCHHFREIAKSVWNDAIDESVQPVSFKGGVLKISVTDSGWAQQVQFKKTILLKRLRGKCVDMNIKDLRTRVG